MNASANYKAYLLRLWLAGDGDQPEWRASLEDPGTGEVRGFSDLDEMVKYLRGVEKEGCIPDALAKEIDPHFSPGGSS